MTIPREVRERLGLGTPDSVTFVLDEEGVQLRPTTRTLETLYGAVPARPSDAATDFEAEIDEAMDDLVDAAVHRPERP
ncbi:MAG: AbrB/MazE/SpoVT family DNA-binding domain-containing protein [Thermomicrobiales bacterium]|nr:AbrB/MazE/SpoVT family DNA-binding domain-containing protein [Thermomicrobiales bacterium]